MAVVILGQTSSDLLQHPHMAQAIEVHKLAVGQVGHHRRFVPCALPHHLLEWLAGTCATSWQRCRGRQQSKPVHDQSAASSVSHTSDWLKGHLITIKDLGHTLLALHVLLFPLR